jgi:glycine/D-amino acid oxidase-like deaminating enzyme
MKITVVGAGIIGLSAAWALCREGHQVTVYEQGTLPNSLGSSVDQHRLIRFPYGRELGYTRMVFDAYRAWEQLWADLGKRLYAPTGTLVLASATESWASDSATTLEQLGIGVRWLNAEQLQAAFPLLMADGVESAFYLDSGGVLLAEKIIAAMAEYLSHKGVILYTQVQVREIDPDRPRIVLEGAIAEADTLVIAAGAWVTRLLPDFGKRVTPSRQVVVYVEPPVETKAQWLHAPMILDIDPECGFYIVPPVLGTDLKIGDHRFTLTGNPDRDRTAGEAEVQQIYKQLERRIKDFNRYQLKSARTCFYTVAPEERFIVEPVGNAWVMSGFSGHGFKFGPLLGLRLAEAIACRCTPTFLSQWAAGEP